VKIAANRLKAHLDKSLLPCYLITGDEHLLVQEALDAVRARAREEGFGSRELHIADGGFDWADLRGAGSNLSLFSERRIVELRLPTGKPGRSGGPAITEFAQQAGGDLLFLVSAPKLDRGSAASKWASTLASVGGLVQIWPVDARELPTWIAARMKSLGLEPEGEAVRLIADRVEGNLLAAQQEIEKLRLLSGPGTVTAGDVDDAVADSSRFNVYQLADAAVAANAARAIRILGGLRVEGTDPVIVVWALTRELRTLAKLADSIRNGANLSSSLRKFGVWRNREGIVRACISRHRSDDFYRLIKLSRRADAAAKGQLAADPWALISDLVLGLSSGSARAA
jgi:DNA polymerase-3 subunit delta